MCYSCQIVMKLKFSRQTCQKYSKISDVMKIRPGEAELLHEYRPTEGRTDGWTDGQS